MPQHYRFDAVARLPAIGDNAAIATRRLDPDDRIEGESVMLTLTHTVLEGHRFAVEPIAAGRPLLSWGLPFGLATRPIAPGEYLCNEKILQTLRTRSIDVDLPATANFADGAQPYHLDEAAFRPGRQVARYPEDRFFWGYQRAGGRGIGTRNVIVLLGTTSRTAGFVRALEARAHSLAEGHPNLDGVVAVAHTEGGDAQEPNNAEFVLRTLAGFMVHPNVGAVLAVDEGDEPITNRRLEAYMREHGYALEAVPHRFMSLAGAFRAGLADAEATIAAWVPDVAAAQRTAQPLSALKIALQCGGSDAFSGVSGNPLAAWVAGEVIRYGGAANLAETDELIGAEAYVLSNVRDLQTATRFLATIETFRERLSWHGATAEGNPSGGNNLRGLYNIAIKSIGAAMKRRPDVRLDEVIGYAEPMTGPGFYFMDSPGNDLESIAGQVASGCTMIFFVTGNGSITNFPFVPTIKIVTTTGRYQLLAREMDVNAGAYLDGVPMEELGGRTLDLAVRVASGELSVGERAGHSQVSIWRNWAQRDRRNLEQLRALPAPSGEPLPILAPTRVPDLSFEGIERVGAFVPDQLGLIMPTSLCSGQIARRIADHLNSLGIGQGPLSRFVALPHTEGCGSAGGSNEGVVTRAVLGHLTHPLVGAALLLEHGCEKTHNDYYRHTLSDLGLDLSRFGWASVQADGGIEAVTQRVADWARAVTATLPARRTAQVGIGYLRVGIATFGEVPDPVARMLAGVAATLAAAGGTVVLPSIAGILAQPAFCRALMGEHPIHTTLAYAQPATAGVQVMECPTTNWVEALTGLVATGVELAVVYTGGHPVQGHRMVPVVQITADARVAARYTDDLDMVLDGDPAGWQDRVLALLCTVASRRYEPALYALGNTDFQLTRGLLGVST